MNPVVAVGAHPDDLEVFCGGTLALLARRGIPVVAVVATRGEKGTHERGVDPQELVRVRKAEATEGARLLGLSELVFLDFPDGELDRFPEELKKRLAALYRRYRPQAVFAFDPWRPYELHPDHRTIGWAASDARLPAKLPLYYPDLLAEGLEPWDVAEFYLYNSDRNDTWFALDEQAFARKLQAVQAHRSQFSDGEMRELLETLEAEARRLGPQAGGGRGEGFKRLVFGDLLIFHSLPGRTGKE